MHNKHIETIAMMSICKVFNDTLKRRKNFLMISPHRESPVSTYEIFQDICNSFSYGAYIIAWDIKIVLMQDSNKWTN